MIPNYSRTRRRTAPESKTATERTTPIQLPVDANSRTVAGRNRAAWTVATFFGCGFLRPGPGTWASAITALIWHVAARNGPSSCAHLLAAAGAAVALLVGIPAASVVARESGRKDPSIVVIDEVAGQLLPLIVAPANWKYLFISFILFRGFDIFKPAPVRQLERLPGGLGIMLDDLGAGIYALLGVALLMHFQVL